MPAAFRSCLIGFVIALSVAGRPSFALAASPSTNPAYADPAHTDEDFLFQGEYAGTLTQGDTSEKYGVQVIALGDGMFSAVGYPGGLPGDGWAAPTKLRGTGKRDGAHVNLAGLDIGGTQRRALVKDGSLTVLDDAGTAIATFAKVTHGDATVHIEFRLPYQPKDRGQGRGNSGAYVAGAYEVQMLDSFGLDGKNNECGGIYSVAAPAVNMCLPPLEWQTYDIDFTAPRFEGDKKVKDAMMTVRHNGVLIHENATIPKITPSGPQKTEQPTGPLYLQDHGNPVRYRNIWVKPKS